MDSNYLNLMHGNFPPFNLDFSPSFLHSKKLNVQPLILWENILKGCLASKKIENSREKKKAKDTLYFTKCKIYISWSPGESSPTAQKMKITKQYISGCLPLYSCLTAKESSNWWITRRELGFRSQISEVKYQKRRSQISGSTQENFEGAQNGCEISQTNKMAAKSFRSPAKLAFSLE